MLGFTGAKMFVYDVNIRMCYVRHHVNWHDFYLGRGTRQTYRVNQIDLFKDGVCN